MYAYLVIILVFHVYRNDLEVDRSAEGNYSTELYGAKAAQIIRWKWFNLLAI